MIKRSRYFRHVTVETATSCAICLQAIHAVASIACSHRFCVNCIVEWAKVSTTCPLCKVSFSKITEVATQTHHSVLPTVQKVPVEMQFQLGEEFDSDEYEMDGFVVPDDFIEFKQSSSESDDVSIARLLAPRSSRQVASPQRKRIRRQSNLSSSSDDEDAQFFLTQQYHPPPAPQPKRQTSKYFRQNH
ncbi:hypothetical protein THRCLA_22466 [Thraustotheca clavata]|uniref:RING-type domain-containing protein n=1 Tax=Thraustotheca clavata TaxID=74557 RepID=A0A1V9Z0E5_9STRA|nr:hypothetical protein THRCLA_22466 [Thraustotheca clavata]